LIFNIFQIQLSKDEIHKNKLYYLMVFLAAGTYSVSLGNSYD